MRYKVYNKTMIFAIDQMKLSAEMTLKRYRDDDDLDDINNYGYTVLRGNTNKNENR